MNFKSTAIVGIATALALTGCASKRPMPDQQQPGRAAYEEQKQAFREGLQTGQDVCKDQAGISGEAPMVSAQLTGPQGTNGCNCSCQSKAGKAKAAMEQEPAIKADQEPSTP